jgi:hypothetical protein
MKTIKSFENFKNLQNVEKVEEKNDIIEIALNAKNEKEMDRLIYENLRNYLKEYREEQINEGVNLKELISKGKEALKTWFFNSLNKIMDLAVNGGIKAIKIAKSIMKAILKFTKKYPKLTKVMVMFLVIVVLMVVSAQSAMASTGDPEMGTELVETINAAIGFLSDTDFTGSEDIMDVMQAKAYLVDMKQELAGGVDKIDPSGITERANQLVKGALKTAERAKEFEGYQDFVEKGKQFVDVSFEKISGKTTIRFSKG